MGGDSVMKLRQRRQLRRGAFFLCCCCLLLYYLAGILFNKSDNNSNSNSGDAASSPAGKRPRPKPGPELLRDLSLGEEECRAAFPGLTKAIDDVVAEGPFRVRRTGDRGPLQGRVKDGQIYILNDQSNAGFSVEMLNSRNAALHQLHRAIVTSPEPIPDTIFALNFQDQPWGAAWTYSQAADPLHRRDDPNDRAFLMPHFSFWAWPLPFVGSMGRAGAAISAIEEEEDDDDDGQWDRKIAKAVWRGTAWFNSVHSPGLRDALIAAAAGRDWADVEPLRWERGAATNALRIEDFCRYRYVLHTEGVTYSGRFQFLQMCASVVLTPPLQWLQHTTHLVRPLFSSTLDLTGAVRTRTGEEGEEGRGRGPSWTPSERTRAVWPIMYPPEEANIIFVAPDWSDLEDTIAWLEAHPDVAEGIGLRQRELFVGGGYFSPAAEACYWRALVRGWAEVARPEEKAWDDVEGTTFEAFVLRN